MKNRHNFIVHKFNPLHIYCRLVHVVGKRAAKKIGRWYEKHFGRIVYL